MRTFPRILVATIATCTAAERPTQEDRISALEAPIAALESKLVSDVSRADQMRKCADAHMQVYPESCIPMAVELVLKLAGRVATSYYDLQFEWKKKPYGTFDIFVGRTVAGLTFQSNFTMPRGAKFPYKELFATIDKELDAGRFVIIGVRDDDESPFHAWVIAERLPEGEYRGLSKYGMHTLEVTDIKARIISNGGTEIDTYTESEKKPNKAPEPTPTSVTPPANERRIE